MSDLLYAFGLGIAFVLGAGIGVIAAGFAIRTIARKASTEITDHNNRVEDRLASYVAHTERIAVALEAISKKP